MKKRYRLIATFVCAVLLFTAYGGVFEAFATDNNATIAAGGTLASGTYTLSGNIDLAKEINISYGSTVTIQGSGTITNAQDNNMIQSYGNLSIIGTSSSNPIIIDQKALNGYTAIWNLGSLTLQNVVIQNAGKSNSYSNNGGAISSSTTDDLSYCSTYLNMTNVTIKKSYANHGAAVYVRAEATKTVQMTNVTIENCYDYAFTSGYAPIAFVGSKQMTATLNNVNFTGCKAYNGGAIYYGSGNASSSLTLTNSTFTNCTGYNGGAICLTSENEANNVTVSGCTFTNCAGTNGGAVYITGANRSTVTLGSNTYTGCTANDGGGIYFRNTHASSVTNINDSTFTGCGATESGGAVFLYGIMPAGTRVAMSNCKVSGCSAKSGMGVMLSGAGCATFNATNTIFENCTSSGEGGTIRTNGNGRWISTISDCVFRNNTTTGAGGGIYWNAAGSEANLTINDCHFLGNTATGNQGGGLFLEGSSITITGSDGVQTAPLTTGDIPQGGITGTVIKGNTSKYGGGISFKTVESVAITGSSEVSLGKNIIITENHATISGGGISYRITKNSTDPNALFHMIINGSEITNNTAAVDGGGIFVDRTVEGTAMQVSIKSGTVTGNRADGGDGGALNISGGNAVIGVYNCPNEHEHPEMNNNTSGGVGGGIAISGGTATMYCGVVVDNTSEANQGSNNFNQSGADTSFEIVGGTFGPGVNIEEGEFSDERDGLAEEIFVRFINYYDGETYYVTTRKVVLVGGAMALPTSEELGAGFSRPGYKIYGWSVTPGVSDGCLLAGNSAIITAAVDYYTVWVKNTYTVTTTPGVSDTNDSDGGMADNNGYNYNVPFTASTITPTDGVKDAAYSNGCVILQKTYASGANSSNTSTAVCYVVNDGTGIYLFVEVTDSTLFDTYTHYTNSNPKGDFVEFFIDFPNNHKELYEAEKLQGTTEGVTSNHLKYYRNYVGYNDGTSRGGCGWIVIGPPGCNLVSSWGFDAIYTQYLKSGSTWRYDESGTNKIGYNVELYVPFPTTVLPNATDKLNTECIGIGYETYNVIDDATYTNVTKEQATQRIYASGNYAGQYYLRYDYLPNFYLTPNTTVENPTSYEFTTDDEWLSFATPMQKGEVFNGWKISSNGNWTSGSAASDINIASKYGDLTLTANWATRAAGTYSITYNLCGGQNNPSNPNTFTSAITLKDPTREGYTFAGWVDIHRGGAATKSMSLTADRNYGLYATWTEITYTVDFLRNEGTLVSGSLSGNYTEDSTLPVPTVTRSGYILLGWFANETVGNWQKGEQYIPGTTGKYGNVTLRAVWAEATANVTFSFTCDDDRQGYILTITGTANDGSIGAIDIKVMVKPGETVKLRLPVGEYVVRTYDASSWRYEGKTLNLVLLSNTDYVYEMGEVSSSKWLNGYAYG